MAPILEPRTISSTNPYEKSLGIKQSKLFPSVPSDGLRIAPNGSESCGGERVTFLKLKVVDKIEREL
jgi:hypothetical protein